MLQQTDANTVPESTHHRAHFCVCPTSHTSFFFVCQVMTNAAFEKAKKRGKQMHSGDKGKPYMLSNLCKAKQIS